MLGAGGETGAAGRLIPPGDEVGHELHGLIARLYPICRSLTGEGVRETLRVLQEVLPLELVEVPSGTPLFDWVVPREWNIREAWIADADGRRIVDFADSNLHVVGYSTPVEATLTGAELDRRLVSLPEHPDWVPARTAYWEETWGFCLADRVRRGLDPDALYEVRIDSSLEDGHLTYGECVLPGELDDEVLLSTYVCHPSLCNDNLSGIAVLAALGGRLAGGRLRHTYRLLFGPGTLGPLAWLARNEAGLARVRHGLAVCCVGDRGPLRYKRSRRGSAAVDRAAVHVLRHLAPDAPVEGFVPWGGDERQFCSPGFDLPVGTLTRTPHGLFPEYHTSADDLELVTPESLAGSLRAAAAILDVLEGDEALARTEPRGEPQLGRRGLYGPSDDPFQQALLWTLNLADGRHSLLDVAERAGLPFGTVRRAADALLEHELLRPAGPA